MQREVEVIRASPEWIEYELVSNAVIERIYDLWVADPSPVTARTIQQLHKQLADAEVQVHSHYRDKRLRRVQREEDAALAAQQQQQQQQLGANRRNSAAASALSSNDAKKALTGQSSGNKRYRY